MSCGYCQVRIQCFKRLTVEVNGNTEGVLLHKKCLFQHIRYMHWSFSTVLYRSSKYCSNSFCNLGKISFFTIFGRGKYCFDNFWYRKVNLFWQLWYINILLVKTDCSLSGSFTNVNVREDCVGVIIHDDCADVKKHLNLWASSADGIYQCWKIKILNWN